VFLMTIYSEFIWNLESGVWRDAGLLFLGRCQALYLEFAVCKG